MTIVSARPFGMVNNQNVTLYELKNNSGMCVTVMDYGCTITSIQFPDKRGNKDDIVLGFDTLDDYLKPHPFFGCIVGRCANRIHNGDLPILNQRYQLTRNETSTGQHLHGGDLGFNRHVWQSKIEDNGVLFTYLSPNGEEHYPGNLNVSCYITLDDQNALSLQYWAETDAPTIVNLTNHSYFNLAGHQYTTHQHHLQIEANFVTPLNEKTLIPTGEIVSVTNTPYDFRRSQCLNDKMKQRPHHDFDINYVLTHYNGTLQLAATLFDPQSGREMQMLTNQAGVQFYNASKLGDDHIIGKQQTAYRSFSGLCLEAQSFPDSVHYSHFPSTILMPEQTYYQHTVYQFSTKQ